MLILSILINFYFLKINQKNKKKIYLIFSITINLLIIFYFKYLLFFVDNFNFPIEEESLFRNIILPIGISFYTFQQISAQVDIHKNTKVRLNFFDYMLYVIFFPQLIAGPIIRIQNMMLQLQSLYKNNEVFTNIAIGVSLFTIGFTKKVMFADHLGINSDIIFLSIENGLDVTFWEAWFGILSYSFQIYFDFSAYCEMAAGIAISLSIKFPLNFYSPYRAQSIIEFWKRWHMTLSEFFRDYLYIPLGGNKNKITQFRNIFLVMALCGFWHGAGWLFIIWGSLHGIAIIINHIIKPIKLSITKNIYFIYHIKILFTFLLITLFWVPFRAVSVYDCYSMYKILFGLKGIAMPTFLKVFIERYTNNEYVYGMFINGFINNIGSQTILLLLCCIICFYFPNTYQMFPKAYIQKKLPKDVIIFHCSWYPSKRWAGFLALILVISIVFMGRESTFLYFQF